jgi:hypothetical protein
LFAAGAVVVQQFASVFRTEEGEPIPFFDPDLWSFWLPYLIVGMLAGAVVAVIAWRTGHWTYRLAAVDTLLAVAVAALMIWLAVNEWLLNPAWFDAAGWPEPANSNRWLTQAVVSVVAVTAIWTIIDVWMRAVRGARHRVMT